MVAAINKSEKARNSYPDGLASPEQAATRIVSVIMCMDIAALNAHPKRPLRCRTM